MVKFFTNQHRADYSIKIEYIFEYTKSNYMKRIFSFLLSVNIVLTFAQEKLIVEYESTMEFDISKGFAITTTTNDGGSSTKIGANKEIEDKLKEAMSKPSYYTLTLTSYESEFRAVEKVENDQPSDGGMVIKISAGQGITYKNLNEKLILKSTTSFNKDFLIADSIKNYDWKISRESKEILGYEVRKAEAIVDSTTNVVAWYTPKLTYKNGPDIYGGLPGLILEIEINSDSPERGKRKISYKTISLNVATDKKGIERPKKGKKITDTEFKAWTDEQREKMQEMYGGGVDKD